MTSSATRVSYIIHHSHYHHCLLGSSLHREKETILPHLQAWQPPPILAHWYWSSHNHSFSLYQICWYVHYAIPLLWNFTSIYETLVFAGMVEVMPYPLFCSALTAYCQRSYTELHLLSSSLLHKVMTHTPRVLQSPLQMEFPKPQDYRKSWQIWALTLELSSIAAYPSGKRMNYNHFR